MAVTAHKKGLFPKPNPNPRKKDEFLGDKNLFFLLELRRGKSWMAVFWGRTQAGISFVEGNECCEDAVQVIDGSFSQITKKRLEKFVRKMHPCYFPINLEETLVNFTTKLVLLNKRKRKKAIS